jgi:hypothetical protein
MWLNHGTANPRFLRVVPRMLNLRAFAISGVAMAERRPESSRFGIAEVAVFTALLDVVDPRPANRKNAPEISGAFLANSSGAEARG